MTELFKQFKYALRHGAVLRYSVFIPVLLINIVFGLLALFDKLGFAAAITAISLSGVGLGAVVVVNIIAGITNLSGVLSSPDGYAFALTPVKSAKILFARMFSIIVQDMVTLFINIFGTVWLSMYIAELSAGMAPDTFTAPWSDIIFEMFTVFIYGFVQYTYVYMFIVFCVILKKSMFFTKRGKTLLTVLCGIAVFYVLSLLDFSLLPFSVVDKWFLFYGVTIYDVFGFVLFLALSLARTALLFFMASRLMDRRINY